MAQKGVRAWQNRTNSFPVQLFSCCNNLEESLQCVALTPLHKCCMCHQGTMSGGHQLMGDTKPMQCSCIIGQFQCYA